jgi:phosphoadenosine phosphosulfate reductase family protein
MKTRLPMLPTVPAAIPPCSVAPNVSKSGAFVVYRGPSAFDGREIVAILTGAKGKKSSNAKTGPMAQLFILVSAEHPRDAQKSGADATVCGTCPYRPSMVSRPQGDLLDHVEARGKWPGPSTRFCTSDHKRAQVYRLLTQLAAEHRARGGGQVRILNCMGMRAQESAMRAKLEPLKHDAMASNGRRHVDTWLPLHDWTEAQVWSRIRVSGVRHHPAYDLGMPRLSCAFCIYAPRDALLLAGLHNRPLLDEYVAVEQRIGHDFKHRLPIVSIRDALDAGEKPRHGGLASWCM